MKKLAVVIGLALSASAIAQAPQAQDPEAMLAVAKQQRNEQADLVVALFGRITSLEKQLQEAKAKACEPKKDDEKKN